MMHGTVRVYSNLPLRLATVALAFLVVPSLQAATINVTTTADTVVPSDLECSIREALNNANLNIDTTGGDCLKGDPGSDDIIIPADPLHYTITRVGLNEDGNVDGDFDVLESVRFIGASQVQTIIDGDFIARVFDVHPTVIAEFFSLTILFGEVPSPDGGGAIRVAATATAAVGNVDLVENRAASGGAVLNDGQLNMINVVAINNAAPTLSGRGGGLYNRGVAVISQIDFSNNISDGDGGGIYNENSLTADNIQFVGNSAGLSGGGLYNKLTAVVSNFEISANVAQTLDGGGIFHGDIVDNGADLQLNSGTIAANSALRDGAGILSWNNVLLDDVHVVENVTNLGDGGGVAHFHNTLTANNFSSFAANAGSDGGGLLNRAVAILNGSLILDNNAVRGGGAFNTGTMTCEDCRVENNHADPRGGGIMNEGTLFFRHSLAAFNESAGDGGGLVTAGASSELYVHNSTLSQNIAQQSGGGVEIDQGTLFLDFATVAQNVAGVVGGGVFNQNAGSLNSKNSILHGNTPDDCDPPSTMTSLGYNMVTDSNCLTALAVGDMPSTSASLGALANNFGLTFTHGLSSTSPAVDSADPLCEDQFNNSNVDDQRRMARPQDGDLAGAAVCDRGAYELVPPPSNVGPAPFPPWNIKRITSDGTVVEPIWNPSCVAADYHIVWGDLHDTASYVPLGSSCNLGTTGTAQVAGVPPEDLWFVLISNDGAQTEGSWGEASSGTRNGNVPSNQCGNMIRDNTGTCPP